MHRLKNYFKVYILRYLYGGVESATVRVQKSGQYLDWLHTDLVDIVNQFIKDEKLDESAFFRGMDRVFKTDKFTLLTKKWMVWYLLKLFNMIDDHVMSGEGRRERIVLEDNKINRFAVRRYTGRFPGHIDIKWIPESRPLHRVLVILSSILMVLALSLKSGITLRFKKKKFGIMIESSWGLRDVGGYYFHDDFLVDGESVKTEDLLLYSRSSIAVCEFRRKAYSEAKEGPYEHFYLPGLRICLKSLVGRIIPRYLCGGVSVLSKELLSPDFSLFSTLFIFFASNAIPYEKIFSQYSVGAELGRNYYNASHIAEAIVCRNFGTRYYLMHWSDQSLQIDKQVVSFLGCDKYLIWGAAHLQHVEGPPGIAESIGYCFKKPISRIRKRRKDVLQDLGIDTSGKVISFFDESFSREIKITEEHFLSFWDAILRIARSERGAAIVVKPKQDPFRVVSRHGMRRFEETYSRLKELPNVHIIDFRRWSFIEAIGVADLVITQSMTSSTMIALICGIQGLYFDQTGFGHKIADLYKDRIVFDDHHKLALMVHDILAGKEDVFRIIPKSLIEEYNAYPDDDDGIERMRAILGGKNNEK